MKERLMGRWKWCLLLLAALLPALLPATIQAGDAKKASRAFLFRVRLRTTSDWTTVRMTSGSGSSPVVTRQRLIRGTDAPGLRLEPLAIGKTSHDRTPVEVEWCALFEDLSEGPIKVLVLKGDLGETIVEVFNANKERPKRVARFRSAGSVKGDPENRKVFSLEAAALRKGGPVDLPSPARKGKPQVLAFYYPWYGSPFGPSKRWVHWNPRKRYASTNTPLLGYYDSLDENTLRTHTTMARQAQIDAWIVSWWGQGSFGDRVLEKMVRLANEVGFSLTIYYEAAKNRARIIEDLSYILSKYGGEKCFFTAENRPVLFIYGRVTNRFRPSDWNVVRRALKDRGVEPLLIGDGLGDEICSTFDGIHTYNPVSIPLKTLKGMYRSARYRASDRKKWFAATVSPGYDDTVIRTPGMRVDRKDGEYYRNSWAAATASDPDWILITSFNEWHEGSEIEPSKEHGRKYLDMTGALAAEWKAP
jgi:hypothetical protein